MAPRPYHMRARHAATVETRARIVGAARDMLSAAGGFSAFTIDAVARHAGVARMTVYHQFGSKTGLVEAVFDSLAIVRTGVQRLVAALGLADPAETLAEFIRTLATVWQEDRLVIRRLQGLAALDSAFSEVWHAREGRRREGMRQIATRLAAKRPRSRPLDIEAVTAALYAVVAYETFDAMAGPDRTFEDVAHVVHVLARRSLGLDDGSDDLAFAAPPPSRKIKRPSQAARHR